MSENTISPDIECCECDSCVDCQYFLYFGGECQEALPAHIIKTTVFAYTTLRNAANPLHPATLRRRGLSPSSIRVSDVGILPQMMAITFTSSNA